MKLLIKEGTVVNPGDKTERKADIFVENGVITEIGPDIAKEADLSLIHI